MTCGQGITSSRCPAFQGLERRSRKVLPLGRQVQLSQPAGRVPSDIITEPEPGHIPERHGHEGEGVL